jgi:adenine-specific DNA-methyltransferase
MDKLKMCTPNLADEKFTALASMFPNAVTETIDENGVVVRAIDADVLAQEINTHVVSGKEERYQFTWPDKKKSVLLANAPIAAALRPCREESVDFDNTENLYIEGDNLDVLKLLRETYLNRVKMIYIDPPYNTGKDFIYEDDFAEETGEFLRRDGQYDEQGNRLTPNLDSNGRFHTDWLNMIYPRLRIARDLLTDDGVIFVSCDDNEQENFKKILNEIFGERNSLGLFIINSTPNARDYGHIGKMHEFVLFYAKNFIATETNLLPELDKTFKYNDERGGFNVHPLYNSNEAFTKLNRPNLYYPFYIYLDKPIDKDFFAIGLEKKEGAIEIYPPKSVKNGVQFVWRWGKEKALKNLNVEIIGYKTGDGEYRIVQKMRHSEKIIRSILSDTSYSSRRGTAEVEEILEGKIFDFPKPISLLKDLVKVGAKEDSIILDFFSGSATTAHAVMQLNAEDGGKRKFIMVQLPEPCDENSDAYKTGYKTIAEIGKERIRRAGKKIKEDNKDKPGIENLDIGFRVLKLDSSNMKDVYYTPEEYAQMNFNLEGFMDNIKPDRTEEDLLFQVMLDLGIPLSAKIRQEGETFYVNDNYLIACFGRVDTALITEIAKKKPYYAVFRDSSFINDSAMVNFEQVFSTYSPNTIRRVL